MSTNPMSFYKLPLSALRAFEAAARRQSYSRAAEELGLSHGAISHHIKSLEEQLGVSLFKRAGSRMVPTEHGQRLALHASDGLGRLAQGVEEVRARLLRSRVLTVSVLPAFASRWLIPRLDAFRGEHPDVEVNIRTSPLLADFERDGIDLGLRYGPGQWPGLTAQPLFGEHLFPVCSPAFRKRHRISSPGDLLAVPLLRDQRIPWSLWFRAVGMKEVAEPIANAVYSDAGLLLEAAAAGHGVALARSVLAHRELASRQLRRLFNIEVPADFAYYLVYPSGTELRGPAQIFTDWLLRESANHDRCLLR